MAYLIFSTFKGRELARKTLRAPLVVGRSPECDICVHDILLSRRHCQFEPEGDQWILSDLASKNGTYLNDQEIGRHQLTDGETVRLGKTTITFRSGTMPKGGRAFNKPNKARLRPADPWAALHDTMSGFDYLKARAEEKRERIGGRFSTVGQMPVMAGISGLPTPQPTPRDPGAYQAEDIYSLLTELASSSWDSIYMNVSRPAPTRPAPRPMVFGSRHPRHRHASPVDMSLQVDRNGPGLLAPQQLLIPKSAKRAGRLRRALLGMARGFVTIGGTVTVLGIIHLLGKV